MSSETQLWTLRTAWLSFRNLALTGELEKGGVGGIFGLQSQTEAAKDIEEILNKFAELLGSHSSEGCSMEPVEIRLKDPDEVIWVPPRPLSQKEEEIVDEEVEELLHTVQSRDRRARSTRRLPWLNRKPRTESALISQDSTRMLRTHIIHCLGFASCWKGYGITYLSAVDFARRYHQLSVTTASRRLLALSTHNWKHEWCRLSFGVIMGPIVSKKDSHK